MMHEWGMMNWGWGGMIFQLLFWFVIIGLIIWGVKAIIGQGSSNRNSSASTNSALETLKNRYARGEIDREEFEQKKNDLLA